jgi:hypothetical protein
MSNPSPLIFRIGLQTYAIDDPVPGWHVVNSAPRCSACDKPLHLIWGSPPASELAQCECTSASGGRKVVQSQASTASLGTNFHKLVPRD